MRSFNLYRQLLPLVLLISTSALAQRQYWGFSLVGEDNLSTGIFCVDSTAMDLQFVHFFGANGGGPYIYNYPSLLLASNGLIYGAVDSLNQSFIFSYDPVVDTFQVRAVLGTADFPNYGVQASLTEGAPGVLYGATALVTFKFFSNNDSLALCAALPNNAGGSVRTPFVKASNGKLYAARAQGGLGLPAASRVVSLDPTTDVLDWTLYQYPAEDGRHLNGQFIEHDSRLYSTSSQDNFSTTVDPMGNIIPDPKGVIYSCSMGALDHVLHAYFNDSIREPEAGMIKHPNGLWYGMARTSVEPGVGYGLNVLYSYDVSTNIIALVKKFIPPMPPGTDGVLPGFMLGSNGKFYGSLLAGLFEYDLALDTFLLRAPFLATGLGRGPNGSMIEICRKPNYKPRPTTSFNVCAGAHFFYDLRNVNATNVVWRRDGVVVPSQTDQRLEFTAITEGDEGVWACTMTNECGVTVPPSITITVNAGAFSNPSISGDTLLCGAGDVAVLVGNTSGIWNNGVSTPTLSVTQPGQYYAYRQQACGLSMSEPLEVLHLDSIRAPYGIQQLSILQICPGDSSHLGGNLSDAWNIYPMGTWNTGDSLPDIWVQEEGSYYVTRTNACNSDTSNVRLEVEFNQTPALPQVGFLNGQGLVQSYPPCSTDSITIVVTATQPVNYYVLDNGVPSGTFYQGTPFVVQGAHELAVISIGQCGFLSDTLFVTVNTDGLPPQDPPTILPDLSVLEGCSTDTAYLSTDSPNCLWYWIDGDNVLQQDSGQQVLVDWNSPNYTLYVYNGCGNSPPDIVPLSATPAPDVQLSVTQDTVCLSNGVQTLTSGTPTGGTYSGPGVSGNTFDPVVAGVGEHTVTYNYNDGTCTGFAQDVVVVDVCAGVEQISSDIGQWIVLTPNPTTGTFQVDVLREFENGLLLMYDANGKRVGNTVRLSPGTNAISQNELAPGVYQVRLEIDGKTEQRSVVITEE